MSRTRHVFKTGDIPRMWVRQENPDGWARNKQDNLSYRGPSLFSYATEIGRIIHMGGNFSAHIRAFFVSMERYSSTTSQHVSAAECACGIQNHPVFIVPGAPYGESILRRRTCRNGKPHMKDRRRIIHHFIQERNKALDKASRAREHKWMHLSDAERWNDDLRKFLKMFPVPEKKQWQVSLEYSGRETEVPCDDEEVKEMLMAFLRKPRPTDWLSTKDSGLIYNQMGMKLIQAGIDAKHIKFQTNKKTHVVKPRMTALFARLVSKYPTEMRTLIDLKKAMTT